MKRWTIRIALALLLLILALVLFLAVILNTGTADRWARTFLIHRIESSTGARVELQRFHFTLRNLSAELDDLTLHGRERPGEPPFFHADRIFVRVHIISLLQHRFSLSDVDVDRPSIFIRVNETGQSNLPVPPKKKKSTPFRQQLFNLAIANLQITRGMLIFNDRKIPLDVNGKEFHFAMNYQPAPAGKDYYAGEFRWSDIGMKARRYRPFLFSFGTKFRLMRTGVSVDDFTLKLPHTAIEARADIKNFTPLHIDFHTRGLLSLADLRTIMRKPSTPDGKITFTVNGAYAPGQLHFAGHYHARDLVLRYKWFHAGGIESWGDLYGENGYLHMPVFYATALGGGHLQGSLVMAFKGLTFRTDTQFAGANLADVLDAVNNPSMPVHALHWGGFLSTHTVCTWQRDFKHFAVQGATLWTPPVQPQPGVIGVSAQMKFQYTADRHAVTLGLSTINTQNSQVSFEGTLGARNSALDAAFHTTRIADWDDFIDVIRGPHSTRESITGSADWNGKLTGPLDGPAFTGVFNAQNAHFGRLYWDDVTGSMAYSPRLFTLSNAVVKRGSSTANLDLMLQLQHWNFLPSAQWTLHARLARASLTDLQEILGTSYPATATLTADFQGRGTRRRPALKGTFLLEKMQAYGVRVDRASGMLSLRHDYIHITDAKIERDTGYITGSLLYKPRERTADFRMIGTGINLAKFRFLQTKSLPIGGDVDFDLSGQGPLKAPQAHGTVHFIDLKFGKEVLDSFSGTIDSDGRTARLILHSQTKGRLDAAVQVGLADDYPLNGNLSVDHIDLDPFIISGLHLRELTGHSSIDGTLMLSGYAARPKTIAVSANLSRVSLNYEFVKLQNQGPIRLVYGNEEVRVEQARLNGTDTNFRISGYARFSGNRELNLKLDGGINLRLATGLFPQLEARGAAQVNAAIGGTFSSPQFIGQAKIINASAHYGDFPTVLSNMNGEVIFDRSRLLLEKFAAEAGGGALTLSGSVAYGERPVRYEISAAARRVRVRYPEGVSWLLDGNLQFAGTTTGANLTGNTTVERVVFAPSVNFGSMLTASQTTLTGPSVSSPYLRNLQLDVRADAAPGMRIDWGTAHFSAEGGVRVRGTWEHPVVLGNVHLLNGEMAFHGNTYHLNRGDIDFTSPFRFNPVLNVEIATTINPYEITLDFTGPASRLQVSYRSDPPLPSSDIINLLALGSQGEESALMTSSSTQAQNFAASALLSEAVTSQIGAPVEKLFGITNFRIDPFLASTLATTGVTQTTEARVTIQKQVTPDLSVTYSTNAASNQQQVIEVDYSIRRNITIVALRDINGIYGISVKFTNHFR